MLSRRGRARARGVRVGWSPRGASPGPLGREPPSLEGAQVSRACCSTPRRRRPTPLRRRARAREYARLTRMHPREEPRRARHPLDIRDNRRAYPRVVARHAEVEPELGIGPQRAGLDLVEVLDQVECRSSRSLSSARCLHQHFVVVLTLDLARRAEPDGTRRHIRQPFDHANVPTRRRVRLIGRRDDRRRSGCITCRCFGLSARDMKMSSPRARDRNRAASCPRTLLPAWSSGARRWRARLRRARR